MNFHWDGERQGREEKGKWEGNSPSLRECRRKEERSSLATVILPPEPEHHNISCACSTQLGKHTHKHTNTQTHIGQLMQN